MVLRSIMIVESTHNMTITLAIKLKYTIVHANL
jgi:hypothetical protein